MLKAIANWQQLLCNYLNIPHIKFDKFDKMSDFTNVFEHLISDFTYVSEHSRGGHSVYNEIT